MKKNVVCITCPKGCRLSVKEDVSQPEGFMVEGNVCKRGKAYGIKELTNPSRMLTSTVRKEGGGCSRLPVATLEEIPKGLIFSAMKEIAEVSVAGPVVVGDVIIQDLAGSGIALIATRSMA